MSEYSLHNAATDAPGTVRAPTLAELVVLIRQATGDERRRLEEWYWGKAVDVYGVRRARWYREEYEWLRAHPVVPASTMITGSSRWAA